MWSAWLSNPGPLAHESDVLATALCSPAERTLVLQRQCHDVRLCEVSSQKVFQSLRNGAKHSRYCWTQYQC